ncbi:MAG: lytic murein transglycosylase [Methylophilaceae bacterium]
MHKFLFILMLTFSSAYAFADVDATFSMWLKGLKNEARAQGISEQTIDSTFEDARFIPSIITLDRAQPEFITTFSSYISKRVTHSRVLAGRLQLKKHKALLEEIELQYGIPKTILVAFWGLETNYGGNKGDYGLPSALMTLAYEGRRAAFFRSQLMDMMLIVDSGHNNIDAMRGSWAGAMGHMQFMPSTFLAYATDADADGRSNIWRSLPDAFSSAANYLSRIGWQQGVPVALEVKLPSGFEYYQAQLGFRQNSKGWAALGVIQADGTPLPEIGNTAVLLPQGWQGPAFLVTNNFDVVMQWNRSVNYALSVSHLADQLQADNPIVYGLRTEQAGITFNQAWALQARLNEMGYNSGKPDGFPGIKTKQAIRSYQLRHKLPADGYPSVALFEKLVSGK